MPRKQIPPIVPTLFPIEDARPDWTEVACRLLVAIGTSYFAAHFLIDGVRGLLS